MRLKKIKEEYGDKVNIEYRVFMLRPEPDPNAVFNEYRKTGWANAGSQPESGDFHSWESEENFPNCSLPSAEAGLAARAQGPEAWERFHENMFSAFFTENRNITDKEVLCEMAERSGLDMLRFRDDLESGVHREQAYREYMDAVQKGVSGIPSVLVNDEALLVGAVGREQYKYVIDSILETGDLPKPRAGGLPQA